MPWKNELPTGLHGVRNLRFAGVVTDLIADGEGYVNVTSKGVHDKKEGFLIFLFFYL